MLGGFAFQRLAGGRGFCHATFTRLQRPREWEREQSRKEARVGNKKDERNSYSGKEGERQREGERGKMM